MDAIQRSAHREAKLKRTAADKPCTLWRGEIVYKGNRIYRREETLRTVFITKGEGVTFTDCAEVLRWIEIRDAYKVSELCAEMRRYTEANGGMHDFRGITLEQLRREGVQSYDAFLKVMARLGLSFEDAMEIDKDIRDGVAEEGWLGYCLSHGWTPTPLHRKRQT